MKITNCGDCIGCDTDAAVRKAVAEIDSSILLRIERIAAREAAAQHTENRRAAEREVACLLDERSRLISVVLRMFKPCGCMRPLIRLEVSP